MVRTRPSTASHFPVSRRSLGSSFHPFPRGFLPVTQTANTSFLITQSSGAAAGPRGQVAEQVGSAELPHDPDQLPVVLPETGDEILEAGLGGRWAGRVVLLLGAEEGPEVDERPLVGPDRVMAHRHHPGDLDLAADPGPGLGVERTGHVSEGHDQDVDARAPKAPRAVVEQLQRPDGPHRPVPVGLGHVEEEVEGDVDGLAVLALVLVARKLGRRRGHRGEGEGDQRGQAREHTHPSIMGA